MKLFTRIILLFFAAMFSLTDVDAQLTANCTATPTAGCPPLLVAFSNTSTGAVRYRWDLDNGDPPFTLTSVSSSYTLPGTYTATLTAFNSAGDSAKHTVVITVYPLPIVSFTASDTAVCPGAPVTFTSTTVGGVPGPIRYNWNFGDGSGLPGNPVTHAYASPGYYNVTLTATNAEGCNADTTITAFIHVFTPPTAAFSAPITYFCTIPGTVNFSSSVSGVGPYSYAWRFGDGTGPSALANPTHPYTSYGSFTVELTVTDGHSCEDSVTIPAYIFVGHVTASFAYPDTACLFQTVTFPNTSTTHTASNWSYGDGHTGTSDAGSNIYATTGLKTVRLIVADGPCLDTVTHTIYVRPGVIGTFTQNPIHPCPPPVGITFTGSVPPGCTVSWLFGDHGTGTGTVCTHTFNRRGVDTNRMIIHDAITGCIDTIINIDTLYDLIFSAADTPNHGCAPLTVHFSTNAITYEPPDTMLAKPYPWPITSYSWHYGDGSTVSTSSSGTSTHTYTAAGIYYAYVTALTGNGCTVTDTMQILVGKPPVVTFSATPTHVCYGKSVTYHIDVVSGPVDYFYWMFGDGGGRTDTSLDTVIVYTDTLPGVLTVTLSASYNGCYSIPFIRTNYITVDSPKAIAVARVLCSPANTADFGDSSLGDNTHTWLFGDGATSTAKNPVHTYSVVGSYTVRLATWNAGSGCRDTATVFVDLHRPLPNFTADTAICKWDSTTFTATVSGGTASDYSWFFQTSSGVVDVFGPSSFKDGFNIPGIYWVTLVITDQNGCLDTITKSNYIHVGKPVPDFTASPTSGCWPLTVTFTDLSTDIPGATPFTNYAWSFGDGGSASVSTPTVNHTYTVAGAYLTTEIMTDNIGCKDTIALSLVTVYRPTASFRASTVHPCPGAPVVFTNLSVGAVTTYWFFGDGDTSTLTNPTHAYADTGHYTVRLAVTDIHGCADTAVYVAYINVNRPNAQFHMTDSFSICPPLTVSFINTSTGAVSYQWNLGDGSSSVLTNPSDFYISIGSHTVVLVATNIYGCTDTAIGHANIYGYAGGFSYTPDSGCVPLVVHFNATTSNVPNIVWDFSDGTTSTVSFTDTITHVYLIPGAYVPRLILSDNTGCKNSSLGIDTIKVDGIDAGFITIPNPICQTGIVNFQDTSKSYWASINAWYWTFTNGDTSMRENPSYDYTAVGTYPVTLKAVDGWGCIGNITENVNVYPPADITVSPDTTICTGDKATLTGYGGVTYWWSPSSVSCSPCNPTNASPAVVTNYTVTGKDVHGCINYDTVTVFLKDKTISVATGDTQVCFGVVVPLKDSGADKYRWVPGTGLSSASIADPLASPPTTTTYMCIAQLGSCTPDTNYVTVVVHPLPTVDAGANQNLLAGSQAQLQATGSLIHKYLWSDPSTLSCDTCPNPVASMSVNTTYFVYVSSIFGCKNSDSVSITLYCDQSQIFVPNAFTPNGDGQDDIFYPRGKGVSTIKSFRIYNRWGELLFERSGINLNEVANGWDGTFKGQAPHPDVYVWVLDAVCDTGEPINLKGDVTIIK